MTLRTIVEKKGYQRQRMLGGVMILRVLDPTPEAIEAWYKDCNLFMARWQPGQRLRYLHDIRNAERVTSFATDRVARVLKRMRTIPVSDGRGAILLNNAALGKVLSPFLRPHPPAFWQIRFFNDEGDALLWLSE
ncbi:MAG: hypothetical protein KF716_25925 [Anaerolineae bacterium]|nr:hypothetical protein [Anaerolineae bacterium]